MFAVAPTDLIWFEYLKTHCLIDDINFWTPSDWRVKSLHPGDKFIFKLKGKDDRAGGYGTFVEYKYQSLDATWKEFGTRNGFDCKSDFYQAIGGYQAQASSKCGCIVLTDVVFFDSPISLSSVGINFSRQVVKFKTCTQPFPFDSTTTPQLSSFNLVATSNKNKKSQLATYREGQGQFHTEVCAAYGKRCCISCETIPELLQAAHIQDYINKDSNHIQNGLLLRIDLHKLFDSGLLYIDDQYYVHVSSLVASPYYQQYNGKKITLPSNPSAWPSKDALLFKKGSFRD